MTRSKSSLEGRWLHISVSRVSTLSSRRCFRLDQKRNARRSQSKAVQRWEGVTEEELKEFDEASSHPYECNCDLCKKWHELMGPEPEE
jgi:hypothetical protein